MRCKVVWGFSPHGGLYGLKPRTTLRSRRATALCRAARRECEKCGIGGAEDVLARCGVEHQFAEPLVEGFRQPSRRPFFEGETSERTPGPDGIFAPSAADGSDGGGRFA